MSDSVVHQIRNWANPYKKWIRFTLMIICLINIGYHLIEFKDNIILPEHSTETIYEKGLELTTVTFDLTDSYKEDFIDSEFERDKAMLNIIFSLFVFLLLRYGKGIRDGE